MRRHWVDLEPLSVVRRALHLIWRQRYRILPKPVYKGEFACLSRARLKVPVERLRQDIATFAYLQEATDHHSDYRGSFFFQFSSDLDGLASFHSPYEQYPIRATHLMDLIAPHVDLTVLRDVCTLGFHNGAELFWLYDHTDARITGVEENSQFLSFCRLLSESFGLSDRVRLVQSDVGSYLDSPGQFDLIVMHGLIYMAREPLAVLGNIAHAMKPGGRCSIESWVLTDRRPVMQFLSDGSGWGDTFGFSLRFLLDVIPTYGLVVEKVLDNDRRKVIIVRKVT